MRHVILISVLIFCSLTSISQSDNLLQGTWKGTSICQIKNSPCHDETVIYHISKDSTNHFTIIANKLVNNAEEEMGIIKFIYNSTQHILISKDEVKNVEWKFKVIDTRMEGTLMYQNKLYRIINVTKQAN